MLKKKKRTFPWAELLPPPREDVSELAGADGAFPFRVGSHEAGQDFPRRVLPVAVLVHYRQEVGERQDPSCKKLNPKKSKPFCLLKKVNRLKVPV